MKYLHTMVRVTDVEASLRFYRDALGLEEIRRTENEKGRYTLIFLAPPGQHDTPVELTYNWDPEVYTGGRNFGHLAYEVDDIYAFCEKMQQMCAWQAFLKPSSRPTCRRARKWFS